MKHLILAFIAVPLLSSCYAFLKADKLVYTGTMAKRPVTMAVDSTFEVQVEVQQ